MNEAEWLTCEEEHRLIEYARHVGVPARKVRLLALACLDPVDPHLIPECRDAVAMVARAAEGECSGAELFRAREVASRAHMRFAARSDTSRPAFVRLYANEAARTAADPECGRNTLLLVAVGCTVAGARAASPEMEQAVHLESSRCHSDLIREVLGNPFHPVAFSPNGALTQP